MTISTLDELERLEVCTTTGELTDVIEAFVRKFGFEHWMYALDLPVVGDHRRQFMLGGYPDEWVTHYFANDYLRIDPVIAHCQTHATPFKWPDARTLGSGTLDEPVERLFVEAGEFGLSSGLTIPIHGLGCSWGLMSFAADKQLKQRDIDEMLPRLHYFAHCVHESAHAHAHGTPPSQMPHLTSRELECLRWVAAGKTSWEIGRLLSIAERTVVFHLQNATRKLGSNSRQAAVVRAIVLGLISP